MKLKRLLASGRTLAKIRDSRSPYAMRAASQLPTFGNEPEKPEEQNFTLDAPNPKDTGGVAQSSAAAEGASVMPEPKAGLLLKAKNWILGSLPGKKKRRRILVQGELSLENVQVMRNDLSDSDLELVFIPREKTMPRTNHFVKPPGSPVPTRVAEKREIQKHR